ncbi:MAG: response regulator, partial [Marmoricola sp.]
GRAKGGPVAPAGTVDPAGRGDRAHPVGARPPGAGLRGEDDDDLADVLTALLAEHSVTSARAAGVDEAIRLASEIHPTIVVLDLELPDGNGSDVVAALRRDPRTAGTDLVVYSAADVESTDRERVPRGRPAFPTKPRVAPAALARRVRQLLDDTTSSGRSTT